MIRETVTVWKSNDGKCISENQKDVERYEEEKKENIAYKEMPIVVMVEIPITFGHWKYVDTEEKYLIWKKIMYRILDTNNISDIDIDDHLYDEKGNWQPSWVIVASYDIGDGDGDEEYFAITKRYVEEKVLLLQKMLGNMTEVEVAVAEEKEILW